MIRKIAKSLVLLAATADMVDAMRFKIKLKLKKGNISEEQVYARFARMFIFFGVAFGAWLIDEVITLFKK